MKSIYLLITLLLATAIYGHDEGHGPAIKDESLKGGKVTGIIKEGDITKGRKANLLFKAELVYESRKSEVKIFLYDKNMKKIEVNPFSKVIEAVLLERNKKENFTLKWNQVKGHYEGKRPTNKRVPFSIDIRFTKGKQKLFGAFDGLD